MSPKQLGEMRRARLLLAFDDELDRDRWCDPARSREMGGKPVQVHEHLTLVVGRAAPEQLVTPHGRLERRALPQLQRIDRLHVVMAVDDDHRSAFALGRPMRKDSRMACRLPDLHVGESRLAGPVGKPFGAGTHIARVAGIGTDRRDTQPRVEVGQQRRAIEEIRRHGGRLVSGHDVRLAAQEPPPGAATSVASSCAVGSWGRTRPSSPSRM